MELSEPFHQCAKSAIYFLVDPPGLVIELIFQLIFPSVCGSFIPTHVGAEADLRFVFCAGKEKLNAIGMISCTSNS